MTCDSKLHHDFSYTAKETNNLIKSRLLNPSMKKAFHKFLNGHTKCFVPSVLTLMRVLFCNLIAIDRISSPWAVLRGPGGAGVPEPPQWLLSDQDRRDLERSEGSCGGRGKIDSGRGG